MRIIIAMAALVLSAAAAGCAPTYYRCNRETQGICTDFVAGTSEAQARDTCGGADDRFAVGGPCEAFTGAGARVGRCTIHTGGQVLRTSFYENRYTTETAHATCPPAPPVPSVDYEFEPN